MIDIFAVSLLLNLDRSHTQCNVRKNKKAYTKCKSEKIPEADSAPPNRF